MKTVLINKLNYLASPFITDATIPVQVSEEEFITLCSCPMGKAWRFNSETKKFELTITPFDSELRWLRERDCFSIINRNQLWFETLTEEQKEELKTWYQSWLDVTETKKLPSKPDWLK